MSHPLVRHQFTAKVLLLLTLFTSLSAFATNGLFSLGYGARQTAIAGSGVAFPQDALIATINPAGVVFLDEQSEINAQYFSPNREYTVAGPSRAPAPNSPPPYPGGTVGSDSEHFLIPSMAFNWALSPVSAVGFAVYGNGGMTTDYSSSETPYGAGSFAADHAGVDYAQVFANVNYSRKFADGKASWGVAAIFNYSFLRMNGLSSFAAYSKDPSALSDNGYDRSFGLGFRVGLMGEILPGLRLGASYQTAIENTFDDYRGLFIHSGEFNIPANAQVGLAADIGPGVLTVDIQQIQYNENDTIGTSSLALLSGSQLGGHSLGFGWDNMTVYKLGYTWADDNGWTWRLGTSYGQQPIPEQEVTFNIVAPGVIEHHYTAGFSKTLANNKEISLALMYAPKKCVRGNSLFVPTDTVELCMSQFSVDVGFSF